MRKVAMLVALGALLVSGCSGSGPHRDGARTYYESLELSSPEAAVATLTDAFAADDFMTVWFTFDQFAQLQLQNDINLLQYNRVVGPGAMDDLRAWLQDENFFESLEVPDQWYLFDQIMLIADRNDAFLIDLSGDVTVTGTEPIEDTIESVLVTATVEGIGGEVVFDTTAIPPGRWRIRRFTVQGDGELIPLSIPSADR